MLAIEGHALSVLGWADGSVVAVRIRVDRVVYLAKAVLSRRASDVGALLCLAKGRARVLFGGLILHLWGC